MIFIKTQLTPYELADVLNISPSAAYTLCRDPAFPAYKLGEGKNSNWRIDPDDLQDWVETKKVVNISHIKMQPNRPQKPKHKNMSGYALKWD